MRTRKLSTITLAMVLLSAGAAQLAVVGAATAATAPIGPAAAAVPVVNVYDNFVTENASGKFAVSITIGASSVLEEPVSVWISSSDGTADGPDDYNEINGPRVTITAGRDHATFDIPIIPDSLLEGDENFTVTISDPVGAVIGDATANVVIVDDEDPAAPLRDCDDGNPYTVDVYSEDLGFCEHTLVTDDHDGDGTVGSWVGYADCDDFNPEIAPRFEDIPGDGIDQNCDGLIDGEGVRNCSDDNPYTKDRYKAARGRCIYTVRFEADLDGDGVIGSWVGGNDCNDKSRLIRPYLEDDVADGIDRNCDGLDVTVPTPPPLTGVRTIPDVGEPMNCPASAECEPVIVDCLDLPSARAYIAHSDATTDERGAVVMLQGTAGDDSTDEGFYDAEDKLAPRLNAAGFALARVGWPDGWNNTVPTIDYGLSTAACRTATVVDHVHETVYVPMGLDPVDSVCGFCVAGNGADALEAAYLLAEYGMETTVDALVLGAGPTPTKLAEACLEPDGDDSYVTEDKVVDWAYGGSDVTRGPCTLMDAAYEETWRADSLVADDNDFYYDTTRVNILIGGLDATTAPAHASAYYDKLVAAGTPLAMYETVPTAGDALKFLDDAAARQAVLDAILWEP